MKGSGAVRVRATGRRGGGCRRLTAEAKKAGQEEGRGRGRGIVVFHIVYGM